MEGAWSGQMLLDAMRGRRCGVFGVRQESLKLEGECSTISTSMANDVVEMYF